MHGYVLPVLQGCFHALLSLEAHVCMEVSGVICFGFWVGGPYSDLQRLNGVPGGLVNQGVCKEND